MEKNWTKEFYRQFPSLIHYQGADERKHVIKFIERLLSQKAQEVEKLKKEYYIKRIEKEIKRIEVETHDEDGSPTDELSEGMIQGLGMAIEIINK